MTIGRPAPPQWHGPVSPPARGEFPVDPSAPWAEGRAELALCHGVSGINPRTDIDELLMVERFAHEAAPTTREIVAAARAVA